MNPPAYDVLGYDEALLRAVWRNCYFMVWRGPATPARLTVAHAEISALIGKYDAGIGIVSIVEEGAPPPDNEARQTVSRFQERIATKVRACATLLDSHGFWASLSLSVLSSILNVRKQRFPVKLCRSNRETAQWLAPRMSIDSAFSTHEELEKAILQIRQTASQTANRTKRAAL